MSLRILSTTFIYYFMLIFLCGNFHKDCDEIFTPPIDDLMNIKHESRDLIVLTITIVINMWNSSLQLQHPRGIYI